MEDNSTTLEAKIAEILNLLNNKAPLESPNFTGTPIAPTPATGTNTTQIATTAYVVSAVSGKANLASPAFTGVPIAPTPSSDSNSSQIATTAYVKNVLSSFSTTPYIVQDGGSAGTNTPSNTSLLWIDTNTQYGNGILKYYNGTAWIALSSIWS